MESDIRVFRLLRLPTWLLSLRTIVVVGALSVIGLVVTLGVWVWIGVTHDQYSQLDRRLDSVSSLGDISTLLNRVEDTNSNQPVSQGILVRTARIGGTTVSVPGNIILPQLADGYTNATINGVPYRVRTFAAGQPRSRSLRRWPKRNIGSTNCTCG